MGEWDTVRLGDVLTEVDRPVSVSTLDEVLWAGVRWYAEGVYPRLSEPAAKVKTKTLNRLRAGDITYNRMWATKAAFGIVGHDADGCLVSSDFPVFEADPGALLPAYMRLIFASNAFQTDASLRAVGTTERRRLKEKDFLAMPVALPSVPEQCRIVAVMSAVDAQIAGLDAEVNRTTSPAVAVVEQAVEGVAPSPLGEVLTRIEAGRSPQAIGKPPSLEERGVLKVSAVKTQRFLPQESKALPVAVDMSPEWEVKGGDLLITRANTPLLVGQVCRVPAQVRRGLYLCDKTLRLVPKESCVDPDYLEAVLALPSIRSWLGASATGTSASMLNLSQEKIRQAPIPLLDLEGQRVVASQVRSLLRLADAITGELAALRVVRVDLLAALLSQEITVDDAVDQFVLGGAGVVVGWHEASTIQKAIVDWAKAAGWDHIAGELLPRDHHDVLIDSWVSHAITTLNPDLADDVDSAGMVLSDILTAISSAATDGLVAANEKLTVMLRGSHSFVDAHGRHVPRRLIDFAQPGANKLVVSDEVTIGPAGAARRFDIVFYVNGFPLVVVETKNPVKAYVSWLTAAQDIYGTYEVEYPNFFATNVFNVATDGNELRIGAVRSQPNEETWALWGSTELQPTLVGPKRTEEAARRLLTPESVLSMLNDFVLYRHALSATETTKKIVARYPQVEGATAIHDKVLNNRPGGLIWHHQGTGKTLLMDFAAFNLLKDPAVGEPTVIILCDRNQLVRQAAATFRTSGMPQLHLPQNIAALRRLLRNDERGVIITTIHKFAEAGRLNDRNNIIVMVDEAHRTQDGALGDALRAAVPNARFFGMTGTPISKQDRNTFRLFGDPDDPDFVMHRYEPIRSLVDGTTVPVSVEARLVRFNLDRDGLDEAFDELATEQDLDEDEKVFLSGKVSHTATLMRNPERIQAVCVDIVEHYLTRFRALDLKAQVVAYDRELVVAYAAAIRAELARRGSDLEVGVDIHVTKAKDENPTLKPYIITEAEEEALKNRFLDINDRLAFLVVTNKLMTGFDAPIEGVLYLDKPLKAQNLFQTISRPNRTWTNPKTKQVKRHGLVVDYIGLAKAIGKALVDPRQEDAAEREIADADIALLAGKFVTDLMSLRAMFAGIDTTTSGWNSLAEARERIESDEDREAFAKGFIAIETVWEFLYPNEALEPFKAHYRWLAALYESIKPSHVSRTLLWEKLGTKTFDLIFAHVADVRVEYSHGRSVKLDAAGLELVKKIAEELQLPTAVDTDSITFEEVVGSIADRIRRRMAVSDSPVYRSLAERLEKLRRQSITSAEDSLRFLQQALEIARDVVAADRMEQEGSLAGNEDLFDPKRRALTQIIEENKPDGLHIVVADVAAQIDVIVTDVAFSGWHQASGGDRAVKRELRTTLKRFGLPFSGVLFDRAYDYVRENY